MQQIRRALPYIEVEGGNMNVAKILKKLAIVIAFGTMCAMSYAQGSTATITLETGCVALN